MKLKCLFAVLTAAYFCLKSCEAKFIEQPSYEDLPDILGRDPALIIFTVKWCEHCRDIMPEIKLIAAAAKNASIAVAHVDADTEPAIAQKFRVSGFPSIIFVKKGYSLRGGDPIEEFNDYRWAEVIAEFVNNETQAQTLVIEPRSAFLEFRKKVPFNKGKQDNADGMIGENAGDEQESLDTMEAQKKENVVDLPHPVELTAQNFREIVLSDPHSSVLALFFTPEDPFNEETMLEWRQATSAIPKDSGDINITIAKMNLGPGHGENAAIAKSLGNVSQTPSVVAFSRCPLGDEGPDCKIAVQCDAGACESTAQLFDFLTNVISKRLGLQDDAAEHEGSFSGEYQPFSAHEEMQSPPDAFPGTENGNPAASMIRDEL